MSDRGRSVLFPLAWGLVVALPTLFQATGEAGCTEWRECRQLALAAADRGEYEIFHDLAWRAVQKGPPRDPTLMYLLARAQSLSGRPHDALVMLERLAEMGVALDAATNEDFRRTRQLPGWPEVEARIDRAGHSSSPPLSSPPPAVASSPSSEPAPAGRPSVLTPVPVAEVVRFSTERFAVGGLAYDAVSHRVLFGDRLGRKVVVVAEGSNRAIDLVRADSAGFHEIASIEIDARRGDLWVVSGAAADGSGTVHRLQLVSGRPLGSFRVAGLEPVKLVDLAVSPGGAVLVLDSMGPQLLALRAGGTSLERVMRIDVQEPASLAAGGAEEIAYVAHRDGVSQIDLRARTATLIAAPNGFSLAHLERIRLYRHALIAVGGDVNGSRRIIRLELNASGNAVTQVTRLDASVPLARQAFVTLSGDELVYLAAGSNDDVAGFLPQTSSGQAELVAYRFSLR